MDERITIRDFTEEDSALLPQVAALLMAAFARSSPGFIPDLTAGLAEAQATWDEGSFARIAVDDTGVVLGFIGGIDAYDGYGWELHPLAVHPDHHGRGIGAALVRDFEEQVRQRGGGMIFLGSDDEVGLTSLYGVDLYTDLWGHIARIRNLDGHAYSFYEKMGYVITGVIPDANGPGKPDILMSKRLTK